MYHTAYIIVRYISVRTNPYPLSNRIIDKRAEVGKYSITCGPQTLTRYVRKAEPGVPDE